MQRSATRIKFAEPAEGIGSHALAEVLQQGLPTGSQVLVRWRDEAGIPGSSISADVHTRLHEVADRGIVTGAVIEDAQTMALVWDGEGEMRAAIVAHIPETMPQSARRGWMAMAKMLVAAHLAAAEAKARAALLEKSERLQQALYEIADLAGSDLEMADMLRRIHAIVAGLMYAENLYIVLYDDARDSLRFLYFADRQDPYVADPALEIPAIDISNSMTLALLRLGEPMLGPSRQLRAQYSVTADMAHGPDAEDWLGVPMRRDDRVCGAVVVQSYDRPGVYSDEERALLSYVAQHILTALDRRRARDDLERRVEERTRALQHSNRDLQAEIVERQRGERLQRALFRIAELSITSETLERFYAQVHDVVGELLYARNFYIALVSEDGTLIEFPYSIDERDAVRQARQFAKGLTEYVILRGHALLAERPQIQALQKMGEVRSQGALAHCWLGVPLFRDDVVVGVIAVQSYSPAISFTGRDQELLTFVAHHIGIGLARKQAQDRLLIAHSELEQRVTSRTRELAQANTELLSQIGERLRAEQQLTYQARHDALTGLPNRSQLLEKLGAAIARAQVDVTQAHASARQFAVLFLDLDRFKLVNDSVGHSAGDELLIEAGRRIVATVRNCDTVARLGGDEFAILISDIDDLQVAEELARRVLVALGEPFWVAGREVFPSASVGIAAWHPRYQNGAELLRDADAAMYRAKASGRNGCAVFDEAMREEAMRILDLEADLRRAINSDDFVAYYQPIVRLSDRRVIGHEALLRWRHEKRGMLSPAEFIGLGEDSGLIEEVDWLMYAQVAKRLAREEFGYISVNVSPRHFLAVDFAERLLHLLDEAGANPHRLRIEITEGALLDDTARALRTLRTLRSNGVLAQLDDFGTGFSALSYLHRFPLECLKVDRSFVAGLVGDTRPESMAVIRAIQALAGSLGIHTIAEGIESEAQRIILRELGCQHGQGFLFGMPAGELLPLVPLPR